MTPPPGGGVLVVDKPPGPTSHDIVAEARRSLGTRRVGHTGTLDPFASGVMLLVVDGATRLSEFLTGLDKTYVATARLGVETDTLDVEGLPVLECDNWADLGREQVAGALASLEGAGLQTPPSYSAKKVRGEAAHRRVRRGESVELEAVPIVIHDIDLVEMDLPAVSFRVRCSSGTYVRALARDLGRVLGVGAHLTALRRTAVGGFGIDEALPIAALASDAERHLMAPAEALARAGMATVVLDSASSERLVHGQAVPLPTAVVADELGVRAAAVDVDGLVAIVEVSGSMLRPRKVFRSGRAAT